MTALVRAELQKLFTTRLWWAMLIATLLYTAVNVGLITAVADMETAQGSMPVPGRDTVPFQQLIWSLGAGATVFTMIVGIVMMTAEYRYQTVTGTFLITPRRGRVVAAKLLAGVAVGVLYGLAVLLLTAVVVIPAVLLSGGEVVLFGEGIPRIMIGVLAALTLYVLFGIGLGALIRNQIGAIIGGIVWVYLIESLLANLPPLQAVGKWTPGGAANSLINVRIDTGLGDADLLPAWAGAIVLIGYAVIFSFVASQTTIRRDIT